MQSTRRGKFWRGPIVNKAQANKIINVTGWVFLTIGALGLLSALASGPGGARSSFGILVLVLLLAVPAAFLLSRRNRASAIALVVACAAVLLLSLIGGVAVLMGSDFGAAVAVTGICLFWTLLAALSWRSLMAASALRQFHAGVSPSELVEVFD